MSDAVEPVMARKMWRTLEPYHGLVYFAPEAAEAYAALGVHGRDGYFASRTAAMGEVPAEVVVATFFNFHPQLVHHAVPAVWSVTSPAAMVAARTRAVGVALRRATGDDLAGSEVVRAAELARTACEGCTAPGRPLYAAHAGLEWPAEAHLQLWQAITLLREFRGDGHVAALVTAELDAVEALVLHAASGEVPRAALQATRGWSDDDWHAAHERLATRGLVDGAGDLTGEGSGLRQQIEDRTDAAALAPWERLGADGCDELRALVRPLSKAIVAGGAFGRA